MTVTKMLNELNSVGNRKKGQNAVRLNDLFPSIDDFAQIIPPGFDPQKDMYLEKIFNIFIYIIKIFTKNTTEQENKKKVAGSKKRYIL